MGVIYQGMKGAATDSFNGKVIDIDSPVSVLTGKPCGSGYFTCLPISEWSYRKNNKTKAKYRTERKIETTLFTVTDDWGNTYQFSVDNGDKTLEKVLAYYKQEHIPQE